MTIFSKYHWLVLLFFVFMTACSPSPEKNSNQKNSELTVEEKDAAQQYYEDVFLPELNMTFRAVSLDLPINRIKEIETEHDLTLAGTTRDYLQYEKDLKVDTTAGIDYVEIKYIFDDADRLDIVTVNYYITDSSMINSLYDYLSESFNLKYGDFYIDSDGYTVWESSYKRNDSLDVTYDIGVRKFTKLNDPGITIELMRFGSL